MITQTISKGDLQDKIREILLSYGEREVDVTVNDLADKTRFSYPQVYQTLYRLQNLGEIELINEDQYSSRSKIVGVKLLKMQPKEVVHERVEGHRIAAQLVREERKVDTQLTIQAPHTLEYIKQKLAISRAIEELEAANLPASTLTFEANPLGEEAIILLDALKEKIRENFLLSQDLKAEKQNVETYKTQLAEYRSRTFDDSGT